MDILKNYKVPTGNILITNGEKGLLECLSLGDYGQENNVKADFLGLTDEIEGVRHSKLLPLEEKWVITVSTQYGCSMGCKFCDVPLVGPGINVSRDDIIRQVLCAMSLELEVEYSNRINIHFARMGEPTWNKDVLKATTKLNDMFLTGAPDSKFHPVVSTMMPKDNRNLTDFLHSWLLIKNNILEGEAGLQLSINTTDEDIRADTMPHALDLESVSTIMKKLQHPVGRKIALNFALTNAYVDVEKLHELFDPEYFMCKITPMHMTNACVENNLVTTDGYEHYYPYRDTENDLKDMGFDVLVFVPSQEEDRTRITCGNAILSGSEPEI